MASLTITIKKPQTKHSRKILVEMDAEKFEKLAASLGFFNPKFLKSLQQAEEDFKKGRLKKIESLRELRK